MRRPALESHFKELTVIAAAERRHGAGYFSLAFRFCGNHYRGQALKLPSWPLNFSFAAAARKPAKILHLQRKGRGTIKVGLESEHLARAADFMDQPLHGSFLRSHFHQNPRAPKDAACESQGDTEPR